MTQGIVWRSEIIVKEWQFGFDLSKKESLLPTIYHANFKPKGWLTNKKIIHTLHKNKNTMLKLKNIDPSTRKTYNQSDCYIQIRITFEEKDFSNGVCYWNAYGLNRSLIEFSLSNPSGALYDIAVPFFPIVCNKEVQKVNANIAEIIGFPLFETQLAQYQKEYYHLPDDNIDFYIYIGKKSILLTFSSNSVILHVVNDSITFGFDQNNNLSYIHMIDMILNEEGFLETITNP